MYFQFIGPTISYGDKRPIWLTAFIPAHLARALILSVASNVPKMAVGSETRPKETGVNTLMFFTGV
jgi:hypothetical protein